MPGGDLNVLAALVAVAEERSFTRAAKRLGVSPSALSHAIAGLEDRIGVRLLARTTRSVAPTQAGEQMLARVGPALADIRGAVDRAVGLRATPAGRVRLLVTPMAAQLVLAPRLGEFARRYPDVALDVTTDVSRVDLVTGRFDAGIQLGEYIARDMIAVPVSRDQRMAVVGAPSYFATRAVPASPRDLTGHRCIAFERGAAGVYRWEFEKGRRSLTVAPGGPLVVNDADLLVRAAIDGVGLACVVEGQVSAHLASGALVRVLEDWCPPFPGYFLYYPSRRQQPAALSALVGVLRLRRA